MQVLAPWKDAKTGKTIMEPGTLKCVFATTGMATVAWSDGFRPTKMSQTLIDVSDEDLAKKRHVDVQAKEGAKDGDGESDLELENDDNDDEPAKKRSRGTRTSPREQKQSKK